MNLYHAFCCCHCSLVAYSSLFYSLHFLFLFFGRFVSMLIIRSCCFAPIVVSSGSRLMRNKTNEIPIRKPNNNNDTFSLALADPEHTYKNALDWIQFDCAVRRGAFSINSHSWCVRVWVLFLFRFYFEMSSEERRREKKMKSKSYENKSSFR